VTSVPKVVIPEIVDLLLVGVDYTLCVFIGG
jgi:hypothetical protein